MGDDRHAPHDDRPSVARPTAGAGRDDAASDDAAIDGATNGGATSGGVTSGGVTSGGVTGGPYEGAATGEALEVLVERVSRAVARARRAASGVVLGFSTGAEVDAVAADLDRLVGQGPTDRDREALEEVLVRARQAQRRAEREAGTNRRRTVGGLAGIHLTGGAG